MSAGLFGVVLVLLAVAFTALYGIAHTAHDRIAYRRRVRRLRTGPRLTLPRQEHHIS